MTEFTPSAAQAAAIADAVARQHGEAARQVAVKGDLVATDGERRRVGEERQGTDEGEFVAPHCPDHSQN